MSPWSMPEAMCVAVAVAIAVWLRPWRGWPPSGPPWAWVVWWALLPLMWSVDRLVASASASSAGAAAMAVIAQPMSGASLLLLMAGWPLAVLALACSALLCVALGTLDAALALHRLVWFGLLPATLALALGAAVRRWLPRHLFVYILARGFFGTLLATALPGWLALAVAGTASGGSLSVGDVAVGRWLAAWGEAIVSGMLVAIFVAYRPQWLATYSDALYLPKE